ncbi:MULTISPECIES: SMP-30/gluconolactonase/LRE family protein [unclassified Pseudoalteromonas]|uniref:SMP-30/gluconolactonase/LRE family protein n=1 Tax=unclassified Pseudoalteromonas TaxID=194690 RepID=UPI0020983895|nr:SMP-30/gluconolactonase/LRE family protein [Pseudoalteromonas sp. XMcav2-N]MCO7186805.1 SMP-30/gluconolactonase/LRE family protein [Pseudoalteromonas sp. XMcav2-N]
MQIRHAVVLGAALSLVTSCASLQSATELYQSQDWVTDGVFTQGVEGPAVNRDGDLFAVNFARQGTIGQVSGQGEAGLYLNLPQGSTGNGIRFDAQGTMYIADYTGHNVLKVTPDKTISVLAHNPKMHQPNDLAISDKGILYASDPDWQNNTGQLWRILPDGQTELLRANMGTTNGIEVSPDNRTLYVNESVQRRIWAFELDEQGMIGDPELFYEFNDHGLDGMRCDENGNLYVARYGAGEVVILSPKGQLLRKVVLKGQYPTNIAFGGKQGKQVFVTMQKRGAIETFTSEYAGRSFNRHTL